MKEMSYVSLINILVSNVEEKDNVKMADKDDIKAFLGSLR